ncbi:MAG: outer membrane protein assembly factor BamA [Holosporales bacterium]|jgi:outer membrane protein insertion porin family|nr:outer membrane protein assembly factor BamA [Holosporales bacterium]
MKIMEKISKCGFAAVCIIGKAGAFQVSDIVCEGNQRIDPETIVAYLPIQKGDECSVDDINAATKALNKTGFFEKVGVSVKGQKLLVKVKEYPTINKISYEGNSKLSDKTINDAIKLKPRETLSPAKIREIQQGLLEMYRKLGRHNASVNPKIIRLPDNRVNLVFEINEGTTAYIRRITFQGNNNISASTLKDVMQSKIYMWFRFFVTDDIHDPERFEEDKIAIEKYYRDNGYANARVVSATAELSTDRKSYHLNFVIEEGELFTFGSVSIKSRVSTLKADAIKKDFYARTNERYDASLIEADAVKISKQSLAFGVSAVNVVPKTTQNATKRTIDVVYELVESEKIYISKIVIKGNNKTRDHVIRREIGMEEGDMYNQTLAKEAENRLKNLGFFKKVELTNVQDPNSPDKYVLIVTVEETPTAEAMASASYSTTGGIGVELSYSEMNFFGTGKALSLFLGSGKAKSGTSRVETSDGKTTKVPRKDKFRIFNNVQATVSDPRLLDTDITGSVSGYRYVSSSWDCFDTKELGGSIGISYDLNSNFMQSWEYECASRKFDGVTDQASPLIKYQTLQGPDYKDRDGRCGLSAIKHTISYHTYFMRGLKGSFRIGLTTTWAGLGGKAKHLKNEIKATYKIPLFRKSVLTLSVSAGLLSKCGGRGPHIIDGFALGYESFRGFEYAGFGPMSATIRNSAKSGDNTAGNKLYRDYLGGRQYYMMVFEYMCSLGMPEELQLYGFVFTDIGTVRGAVYKGKDILVPNTNGETIEHNGEKYPKVTVENKSVTPTVQIDETVVAHKILDRGKIRQSIGCGITLMTPFGPVKVTYAIPVRKEKYDEQYRLLIGFSSSF